MNHCKIANYDLIVTVLFLFALIFFKDLFALIFFKDPQQYNHPPIYWGHVLSV